MKEAIKAGMNIILTGYLSFLLESKFDQRFASSGSHLRWTLYGDNLQFLLHLPHCWNWGDDVI